MAPVVGTPSTALSYLSHFIVFSQRCTTSQFHTVLRLPDTEKRQLSMRKRCRKRGTCGGHLAKLRLDFLPSQQSSLHSSIFSMNPGAMMWTLRTPGWFPLLALSRGALFNPCLFAICIGRERLYPTFDLWLRLLVQGKSLTQLPSGWV